jgi:uncharacterized membrane protein
MLSVRLPLASAAVLVVLAVARVWMVWDSLPPVMASHFGPSGRPDGFMDRGAFFAVFGIVAGVTFSLLLALRWVLPRVPADFINMPNKDYWLAPERRRESLSRLSDWMDGFAVLTAAFLLFVLELTLRANVSRTSLANAPLLAGLAGYFLVTIALLIVLYRRFRTPDDRDAP